MNEAVISKTVKIENEMKKLLCIDNDDLNAPDFNHHFTVFGVIGIFDWYSTT